MVFRRSYKCDIANMQIKLAKVSWHFQRCGMYNSPRPRMRLLVCVTLFWGVISYTSIALSSLLIDATEVPTQVFYIFQRLVQTHFKILIFINCILSPAGYDACIRHYCFVQIQDMYSYKAAYKECSARRWRRRVSSGGSTSRDSRRLASAEPLRWTRPTLFKMSRTNYLYMKPANHYIICSSGTISVQFPIAVKPSGGVGVLDS